MRYPIRWIVLVLIAAVVTLTGLFAARGPATAVAAEGKVSIPFAPDVDRMMALLGSGQIDDAMSSPTFLRDDPGSRESVRSRLIDLRGTQAKYLGYDIVAIQRLSDRLQIGSVLAYYDVRPVLFKIHYYRASGRPEDPWTVLRFDVVDDVIAELKDVPTDYPDHVVRVRY